MGQVDTILLVFVVYFFLFGETEGAAEIAVSMFSIEIVTKMVLYYIHERIWYASDWGVIKSKRLIFFFIEIIDISLIIYLIFLSLILPLFPIGIFLVEGLLLYKR